MTGRADVIGQPLLAVVLEDMEHQTLQADSRSSALELLAQVSAIDLLITDIGLPGGMNDHRFAELARQTQSESKRRHHRLRRRAAACTQPQRGLELLAKPFTLDVL